MLYRLRSQNGNLSEFSLALFLLFILFAFPLIDLLGVATGAGTAYLIAHQSATRAASHQRYDSALAAMVDEAQGLLTTGFVSFARISPVGGYNGSGADLYVLATNYRGGGTTSYGPNKPVSPSIDPSTYLYECSVRVKYNVGPTISLAGTPFIGDVPGLGKPYTVTFEATKAAEYPMGLNKFADPTNGSGGAVASTNIPFDAAYNSAGSSWNYPTLYQLIASSGLTCVDDDVVVVVASNAKWTQTHFRTDSFTKMYLDTRADGTWAIDTGPALSANGDPADPAVGNGLPEGALIARVGQNGAPFVVGDAQQLPLPTGPAGTLYLAMNVGKGPEATDATTLSRYAKCKGAQILRLAACR